MSDYNEIDDLITKYLCGEANPDEAIQLDGWRKSSASNENYFLSMQKTLTIIGNTNTRKINVNDAWEKTQRKMRYRKYTKYFFFGIVALILIFIAIYHYKNYTTIRVVTSQEFVVNTKLPDESSLSLDKNSKITIADNFGNENRKVSLIGKATFTVKHDVKRPFIIETSNLFIEDLGTKFTVTNYPQSDTIYVIVEEGIVRLYDQDGNEIIIKAGEKAWYVKSKKLIITNSGARIVKFDFNDTRLQDVVNLIHDTYGESISLSPSSIGECKITTQFFDEDFSTIITILAETLDFTYEYKDGKYIIEGKPCQ